VIGSIGIRTDELKNLCLKVGIPVMEKRAIGFGLAWWAIRVARKNPRG